MIASSTWVLPLFYDPIGLRLENHSASGEPFCVRYLLSPWLRLVVWAACTPVPKHPIKDRIPRTRVYVLCTWTAGRTGSTGRVRVQPFFFADVTATGMQILQVLYLSILLTKRNPTHSVPTLSNYWFKGYPYLCTLVPQASSFKLLATQCYTFLD